VVVGGALGGVPIGLVFAVRFSEGYEIVSAQVSLEDPNGLLRADLIRFLMREVDARGWAGLGVFHPSFDADDKGMVLAMRACGWLGPKIRDVAAWTTVDKMLSIWFENLGDPRPGYAVVRWRDIDAPLRAALETASAALPDNVRDDIDPLAYEERADLDLSFVLVRNGIPIGWHLPERHASDRYRWTCSAVAPGHWSMAAVLILWKRALTEQRRTGVDGLIWGVPLVHINMVRFVLKRLRPALDGLIIGGSFAIPAAG
jgi:hypothetical protein